MEMRSSFSACESCPRSLVGLRQDVVRVSEIRREPDHLQERFGGLLVVAPVLVEGTEALIGLIKIGLDRDCFLKRSDGFVNLTVRLVCGSEASPGVAIAGIQFDGPAVVFGDCTVILADIAQQETGCGMHFSYIGVPALGGSNGLFRAIEPIVVSCERVL